MTDPDAPRADTPADRGTAPADGPQAGAAGAPRPAQPSARGTEGEDTRGTQEGSARQEGGRESAAAAARRRAELDRIFGDVLPDTTRDERGAGASEGGRGGDDWYLRNRPPHHGG